MSTVAVLDTDKQILEPCHPAQARRLLKAGQAAVFRRYPFTIILKKSIPSESIKTRNYQLCIDPGTKTTGFAVVDTGRRQIVFAAELKHRGTRIKRLLKSRARFRRRRRFANRRHRKQRSQNRKRAVPVIQNGRWVMRKTQLTDDVTERFETFNFEAQDKGGFGWVPPSLMSRVYNTHTWVLRLMKIYPIKQLAFERATFRMETASATAMNAVQEKLVASLMVTGLPISYGSGKQTKAHRTASNLPKTHHFDAACVGGVVNSTPPFLSVLCIDAKGYSSRRLFSFDAKPNPTAVKKHHGFNYGAKKRIQGDGFRQYDHVRIRKKRGKSYTGSINCFVDKAKPNAPRRIRVECPKSPNKDRRVGGNTGELTLLQRRDGYGYAHGSIT